MALLLTALPALRILCALVALLTGLIALLRPVAAHAFVPLRLVLAAGILLLVVLVPVGLVLISHVLSSAISGRQSRSKRGAAVFCNGRLLAIAILGSRHGLANGRAEFG